MLIYLHRDGIDRAWLSEAFIARFCSSNEMGFCDVAVSRRGGGGFVSL